jgi:DNA polymerase-1
MKLLLIDGLNILRRIYEANQEDDSQAKVDSAFKSALSSFRRALAEHSPTHVLPAFDFGGRTWRHGLYEAYRASRKPMPAILQQNLPVFYERLGELGLHVVSVPGVEADDVIGTAFLRWKASDRGEAVVLSTDKDLFWLISQGAKVWDHFKSEWRTAAAVEEKFGVPPAMMVDYLALMGDSTDDIPGVSRVGAKTAAKLLRKYGSLEQVVANADQLKGAVGESLRAEAENAMLSRELVKLKTDVSLGLTWRQLEYSF